MYKISIIYAFGGNCQIRLLESPGLADLKTSSRFFPRPGLRQSFAEAGPCFGFCPFSGSGSVLETSLRLRI